MIVKEWIKATVHYNEDSTKTCPQRAFLIGATKSVLTAFTGVENRLYWWLIEQVYVSLILLEQSLWADTVSQDMNYLSHFTHWEAETHTRGSSLLLFCSLGHISCTSYAVPLLWFSYCYLSADQLHLECLLTEKGSVLDCPIWNDYIQDSFPWVKWCQTLWLRSQPQVSLSIIQNLPHALKQMDLEKKHNK